MPWWLWIIVIGIGIWLFIKICEFLTSYSRSCSWVCDVTLERYDSGYKEKLNNKQTRNIEMSFKDFNSLYRGNMNEWYIYYNPGKYKSNIILGATPYYTGLKESEGYIVFVHFNSIFAYIAYTLHYEVFGGKRMEDLVLFSKVADDVSTKIQKRLDKIQKSVDKAVEENAAIIARIRETKQ